MLRSTIAAVLLLSTILCGCAAHAALPRPEIDEAAVTGPQEAVFGAGCFWTVEAVFAALKGVNAATPGYAGGDSADAHYELVASGETNHAESVRVTYDPSKITYAQLLQVFFGIAHDPTQKDRQGPDWGRQYRSVIFYANDGQKRTAESYIHQLTAAKTFRSPIVTELAPLKAFYPAEPEHRDFVKLHPQDPYVLAHWPDKQSHLKSEYPTLLR